MSDLDRCKKYLRSVLLASKCGIPIKQVSREYSYLYEEDIPFRKLNFPSLEKFLKSIPDVCMMSTKKGEMMVEVVGTQATSHIKNLVQNTGKKKGGGGGGGGGGGWSSQSKAFKGAFPGTYPWARSGQASPRQKSRQSQVSATIQAGLGFRAKKQKSSQVRAGPGAGDGRGGAGSPSGLKMTELSVKVWGDHVLNILRSGQAAGGLALDHVEKLYEAKHGETLPRMWSKTLIEAGLIELDNENWLEKTPLVIPAKVRKAGQFGFNSSADSRFRFSELIKDKLEDRRMMEPRRSDFLPDVENKMKQLNIAGIRPMSEGWVDGNTGTPQLQSPSLPGEGEFYDCKICHIVSPGEIYVQSYSSLPRYDKMKKVISEFYKVNGGTSVVDPEPGMLVAVKLDADWLRAQVIFKLGHVSNTMVGKDFLVKLIDIGKVEVVNIRCMRILENWFPVLPAQALQVKLMGVERHDEVVKVVLQRMCLDKVMVGHVIKRDMDAVYLILYDTTLDSDVNINVMLEKNIKELS